MGDTALPCTVHGMVHVYTRSPHWSLPSRSNRKYLVLYCPYGYTLHTITNSTHCRRHAYQLQYTSNTHIGRFASRR